jgi:NAD(P)-dependent dehydrogenase (short-subunit alcohol dehydrogenase family)
MDLHLEGKRTLVTGSTAGIGFAAALGLAREGAEVIVNGRSESRAEAAAQRIREGIPGAKVRTVAADLSSADGCNTRCRPWRAERGPVVPGRRRRGRVAAVAKGR